MERIILHHAIAAGWPLMAGLALVAWSWARAAVQIEPDRTGARSPMPH